MMKRKSQKREVEALGVVEESSKKKSRRQPQIGDRYGKLVVVSKADKPPHLKARGNYWLCQCDCGGTTIQPTRVLNSGNTTSCGCKIRPSIVGEKFGKLTVVEKIGTKGDKNKTRQTWLCKCECGGDRIVDTDSLKSGKTTSCGCRNKTHGMSQTRLYRIWSKMKQRTLNPKNNRYSNYGGRGIAICDEWLTFDSFKEWALLNGYSDDLSIDRIDVNGNYEPSNCRWTDNLTQANNKRTNVYYTHNGETLTFTQWCRKLNIDKEMARNKIRHHNYTIGQALGLETLIKKN